MTEVSKSIRIYDHDHVRSNSDDNRVAFTQTSDDDGGLTSLLNLTPDDVREFGHPLQLTVTIQPGDLLNEHK